MLQVLIKTIEIYLGFGLLAGIAFPIICILYDLKHEPDPKFGPAWKSQMTYFLSGTMMCPVVNFFWISVLVRVARDYVWNWFKK